MKNIKAKVKSLCLSKTNIFAVSLSSFAFLKDIQELITNFASHIFLVVLSVVLLIVLLLINMFLTNSKVNNSIDAITSGNIISSEDVISKNQKSINEVSISIFSKILFSSILFISLMLLGSLFYIKNMDVYYVVLKNNLTEKEAVSLKDKTNSSKVFIEHGLSTRILKIKEGKRELILYNGYINVQKANADLELVKSMNLGYKPYKVGPQKIANYFQKIKYIQNDIFN